MFNKHTFKDDEVEDIILQPNRRQIDNYEDYAFPIDYGND